MSGLAADHFCFSYPAYQNPYFYVNNVHSKLSLHSKNIPINNLFNYIHWKLALSGLVNKPILHFKSF